MQIESSGAEKNGRLRAVAAITTIVAAVLLVAAFFLPYAAGTQEFRDCLSSMSLNPYSETLGMSNQDLADISLFEYVRIYSSSGELGMSETFSMLYTALTAAVGALGVLTLLFAVLRKPVPVIVLSVFTVALSFLLNWDFKDRGVIPSSSYDWGVARWVYLAAGIAAVALAIWQIVLRKQSKRAQAPAIKRG